MYKYFFAMHAYEWKVRLCKTRLKLPLLPWSYYRCCYTGDVLCFDLECSNPTHTLVWSLRKKFAHTQCWQNLCTTHTLYPKCRVAQNIALLCIVSHHVAMQIRACVVNSPLVTTPHVCMYHYTLCMHEV